MTQYSLALIRPEGAAELFPIRAEGSFIGRSDRMDITVDGSTVSRRHVRLWEENGQIQLEDLSSRNGISVNGDRVRNASLNPGDQIFVGQNFFVVHDTTQPPPAEWPKPQAASPTKPDTESPTLFDVEPEPAGNGSPATSDSAGSADEAAWSKYLLDPDKLQRKIAAAAVEVSGGVRSYVLTGASGMSRYRVLATHSSTRNPDGPMISETVVDRVLRKKKPVSVEGAEGTGNTGIACVPMIGGGRCVGVLYVDGGLQPVTFVPKNVERLVQLGRTAGRLLQAAALMKSSLAERKGEGVREVSSAAGRAVGRILEQLQNNGDAAACAASLESFQMSLVALGEEYPHEASPMDVNQVVRHVVEQVGPYAKSRGVAIEFSQDTRALVFADDRDIIHALSAVLYNAIEATRSGASVSINTENKIDGCYVEVYDEGPGMPDDVRGALKSGKELLAHGFGLAAARTAVMRSRGEIRVQLRQSAGTCVTLVLPQRES